VANSWDYIIVGAGSAGCVLATRLSEDPAVRVLLLEAGGWDWHPLIHMPLGWPRLLLNGVADWGYNTEPDPALGRGMECARGKVIGGSSSTNAMAWVKGHPADFDRWAAMGLPGWDHESMLPYFRRIESWTGGRSDLRGDDGPVSVECNGFDDPICEDFRQAVASLGQTLTDDYNGAFVEGFAPWQTTRHKGRRVSAARAYLHPARSRANLKILTKCHVTGMQWDGPLVTGVEACRQGKSETYRAMREVILCGGTINSPQLLMTSGIGPAAHLRDHGIAVKADLPGVGANLQDHISSPVIYARKGQGTLTRNMRIDRLALALLKWGLTGKGFAAALPVADMGFARLRPEAQQPDLQVMMVAGALNAAPWLAPFRQPAQDAFALRAIVLHPESRGQITLASPDPRAAPKITQGFLSADSDRQLLRDGLRFVYKIAETSPLANHVAATIGPKALDDMALDDHIAATAVSVHHPAGTCRMGGPDDAMRVVDSDLRVVGVQGLRVVDASVMPDLTGGNINAPVLMIAERAADLILGEGVVERL